MNGTPLLFLAHMSFSSRASGDEIILAERYGTVVVVGDSYYGVPTWE